MTRSGMIMGTPLFMAPEQARAQKADARSDLFSLGCVLYDLATGVRPFEGEHTLAVLTALALDDPRPVRERNPAIPEALSDLILHGVFDRHPRLRFGVVELSSAWVPQFLMMLDGASAFTTQLNGKPVAKLCRRPSEYFLDHVRVSSFSYENPKRLEKMTGDVFMFCSDYPHSEGTATPLDDYRRMGCEEQQMPGLFHTNVDSLLNR